MDDDQIRKAIEEYFQTDFENYHGDALYEGPCKFDEDAYYRAIELMEDAQLKIIWAE